MVQTILDFPSLLQPLNISMVSLFISEYKLVLCVESTFELIFQEILSTVQEEREKTLVAFIAYFRGRDGILI